ncbi:hypothetical protein PRK78_006098 [Emydomyces testavorans]|uniref:protein-ribulosamine 3-kinase n=1 Tax=Emydomyces testavorans TaxID=2070801 RepID=A0AAF0ILC7_9EURO|nr:hypothetical protein PRK78_006098 [Emydomyces testavorans]
MNYGGAEGFEFGGGHTNVDPNVAAVLPKECRVTAISGHGTSYFAKTGRLDVELADGVSQSFFIKVISKEVGKNMVHGEFESMKAIYAVIPDFVPKPIAWGSYASIPDTHFFLSEYRGMTHDKPDPKEFTVRLAKLHKNSKSPNNKFGFHVTTYSGNLPQLNEWEESWEAYFTKSMKWALKLELEKGGPDPEFDLLLPILFDTVIPRLLRPLESEGRSVKPSLVHGDLWHANSGLETDMGKPLVFDACCFYAHNESTLAHAYMLNQDEFGQWRPTCNGFDDKYLTAYHTYVPKSLPEEDYDGRLDLYKLRFNTHVSALFPQKNELRQQVLADLRDLLMIRRLLSTATMASHRSFTTSPFSKAVIECMRRFYLAVLLEAPLNTKRQLRNSALLTIDLTQAVADEAIERGDSIIVAYHPIIFRGLKSITSNNTQQRTLLRLAAEGISVYSPHTAVDAVPGGMADWLCNILTHPGHTRPPDSAKSGQPMTDDSASLSSTSGAAQPPPLPPRTASRPALPHILAPPFHHVSLEAANDTTIHHHRSTISPSASPPDGFEDAGMGRRISFANPQPLTSLLNRIASALSYPHGLRQLSLATPQGSNIADMQIRTVAACPGSGSSVLMKDGKPVADLLLTGEMSHHEALAAIENGSVVISLFHSNSERGYLRDVMRGKLEAALRLEWSQMVEDMAGLPEAITSGMGDSLNDPSVEVKVSERDRDPYEIMAWSENA